MAGNIEVLVARSRHYLFISWSKKGNVLLIVPAKLHMMGKNTHFQRALELF